MITAEELATKEAREVRYSPALYRAFQFHYKEHTGRSCKPCSFNSDFKKFKLSMNPKPVVDTFIEKNTMQENTFKLKNEKDRIYVPFQKGTVITKDSPDEDVIIYLSQTGSHVNTEARIARFAVLPEGYGKKAKKAKKEVENVEQIEDDGQSEEEISLADLREMHPHIKARSKEDFYRKLNEES